MKTKKLLFGLIEINGTLYNILYTTLCIFILLLLLCGQATLLTFLFEPENGGYGYIISSIINGSIIYFVGSKLLSENNYV